MDFYERIDAAFTRLKVNRAAVGRETKMTGQGVTQKLKKKSAVTPHEIEVYARYAQMSVAEALGEGMVLEKKDELDLVERYRTLSPETREKVLGLLEDLAPVKQETVQEEGK